MSWDKLEKVTTLSELDTFCKQLQPKPISWMGGRKFTVASSYLKDEVSLNDIVNKFEQMKAQIPEDELSALAVRHEIHRLDESANELLKNKNFFTRVLTAIRAENWIESSWSRERVLTEMGNQFVDPYRRNEYLTLELLDEICHKTDVPLHSMDNLRSVLREYAYQKIYGTKVINQVKATLQGMDWVEQRHAFFLPNLIYHARHSNNEYIRSQLAPLLVAGFVASKAAPGSPWDASDFTSPKHPIRSVGIHLGGGVKPWTLGDDIPLLQQAQVDYQHYKEGHHDAL